MIGCAAGCGEEDGTAASSDVPTPQPVPTGSSTVNCPFSVAATDIAPGAAAAAVCDSSSYDLHPNLPYAAGPSHLLDLYLPRASAKPLPVVVWVHGGGWRSGSKEDVQQALRLVCRGFALASIDYRLTGEAIFAAQIHDVKAAVRFLRASAATYGLDAARIAIFGSSAGGHLAALAATSTGVADLEDLALGNASQSSGVQALVDWYGPTQVSGMDAQLLAQSCATGSATHGRSDSPESMLLGCTVSDAACADQVRRANPATYVSAGDPPQLILHGTLDCTVPAAQSDLLHEAAANAQVCTTRQRVLGAGHGGSAWSSAETQNAVAEFLTTALQQGAAPSAAEVNCAALVETGDRLGPNGSTWSYRGTHGGVEYVLDGVLFGQAGAGPFPAVVVSHGRGGQPGGYTRQVARQMSGWGMVAIGTRYTHAADGTDTDNLPQGEFGASTANVLRAQKTRDLLGCVGNVDMNRVAAHGHSMGAFLTGQLLGTYPDGYRAASHTAGGVGSSAYATKEPAARNIRTPYQLHHGDADRTVDISLDQTLDRILTEAGAAHEFRIYAGFDHEPMALDATMFQRVQAWYRLHGVLPAN